MRTSVEVMLESTKSQMAPPRHAVAQLRNTLAMARSDDPRLSRTHPWRRLSRRGLVDSNCRRSGAQAARGQDAVSFDKSRRPPQRQPSRTTLMRAEEFLLGWMCRKTREREERKKTVK